MPFFLRVCLLATNAFGVGTTADLVILETFKRGCQPFIRRLLVNCVRIDDALTIALEVEDRPPPTLKSGGKAAFGG